MARRLGLVALLAVLACVACRQRGQRPSGRGKVVGVADGDTITVLFADGDERRTVKVRLHGVDCPERAQPFGNKARELTSELVFDKQVEIEPVGDGKDRYGRTVARVRVGERALNEELLRAGLAWHYKRYDDSTRYAELEREAREAGRGLWAEPNPVPPWDWRRAEKKDRAPPSPSRVLPDAPFHGNVRSRVLHAPSCEHYRCKSCTARFGTLPAAELNGYRAHSCIPQP